MRVKEFHGDRTPVDVKINDFLSTGDYQVIDIKLTDCENTQQTQGYCIALVMYEDRKDVKE